MPQNIASRRCRGVYSPTWTALCVMLLAGVGWARPVIQHDPVKTAVRGQPVTVLARVTDESGMVKSVTLFYSVSKDVAPFRVVMHPAGGEGTYYGTIAAEHFEKAGVIYYYIEATDPMDTVQETPWYTITVRAPGEAGYKAALQQPSGGAVAEPSGAPDEPTVRWGTIGLIAGGAAAVVAGAFLIGGGDDEGDGSSAGIQSGYYDGTVTECFAPEGASASCSTHAMTIEIRDDGKVVSSTMRQGVALVGILRGNKFTLTAVLDNPTNGVGQVNYNGTVANDTIVGTISGEAMTPTGTGQFSGTFSAAKRP